ncbi:uncharacterized protein LOC133310279 [Gastrolobium bilobum]|uniref:uncharacterized protein LOC133310279 n=1 Tax=Gastrolobium bilobum TaxID=150636 RepID=UPI002AAFB877|nr:uncharacterized protein LOC133310279 [Gastrolobium bilobum]
MTNWAIELSEYDITYETQHAIKCQALADFVMELTPVDGGRVENNDKWKVYVDGSSNNKGNEAEYKALIAGLMQVKEHGAKRVKKFNDSQLVISQVNGKYQVKGHLLIKYLNRVKEIMSGFEEVVITYNPRGENNRADILSKLASTKNSGNHKTVVQQSIVEPSCVMRVKAKVPPKLILHSNSDKLKASELFEIEHEEMLKEAQDWIKGTAQSCSAVAVLVATVVFAAAYTVPGGVNDNGVPVFLNSPLFLFFTIADVVALACSMVSVMMFLSILTSPFEMESFLKSLLLIVPNQYLQEEENEKMLYIH